MATWLKSANFNGTNGGNFYIALYYDILSQSQANNSSSVRYYLYAGSANGYSGSGATAIAKINGNAVNPISSIGVNAYFQVGQLDTTIWHDENGNATANYSASISTTWGGVGSAELSGSFALPKIDRYPQILTAPNFNDEDNPTITYSTVLGFENATVSACISLDRTSADIPYRQVNVENGQYTFELTSAERNTLRNATTTSNTRTVFFFLRTVAGNQTFYSVVERTLSIVNANPTFTYSETETNSGVISVLGSSSASTVIQNASNVLIIVSPVALKGASITRVRVYSDTYVGIVNASPYKFNVPITSNEISIIVDDTRGNQGTTTLTKTLIEYNPVNINSVSFKRENPTSSNIKVNLSGDYLQKTFGSTANVPTIKWKLDNGNYTTIPSTEYSIDTTNNEITITNYELTNALVYTSAGSFSIELSDLLTADTESNIIVLKGIPTYDYGEHDLKVNGDLYVADQDGENAKNVMELLTWNYLDSASGSSAINLPSEFHELLCVINVGGNSTMNFEMVIPYDFLTTTEQGFNNGYYATSSGNAYCRVLATQTSAKIGASYFNTANVLSSSTLYIYYR